jgi:hypothetical protein
MREDKEKNVTNREQYTPGPASGARIQKDRGQNGDYTLEEIAELVDSTVGGAKTALNRGRSKLAALPEQRTPTNIQ